MVIFHLVQTVEENKKILKFLFDEAKNLGMMVNLTRSKMNDIKGKLEELQVSRAMKKMDMTQNDGDEDEVEKINEKEKKLRDSIEIEKETYRKHYMSLKNIKVEIEHMKAMLKKNRKQIQLEFENWWQQNKNNKEDERNKSKVVITGDKMADENIAEFYRMRDEILTSMK